MTTSDIAGNGLLPGMTVQATVTGHEPWGVFAEIQGFEDQPASVDRAVMDRPAGAQMAHPRDFPAVGTTLDMVVRQIRGPRPPGWVRLSTCATAFETLRYPCDFCRRPTELRPGGDGFTLEVRSTSGPGRTSLTVHRECVMAALHDSSLEGPRIQKDVGSDG